MIKFKVDVKGIKFGNKNKFTLIAGPCVIENERIVLETAKYLKDLSLKLDFNLIFKSSFDKANRSSINSFRGPGIIKGLKILQKVKEQFNLPILTDVHESWQCDQVAKIVDVIQIPAFLCRQTDLLVAAAKTGLAINVKKGQFLAPWDMRNIINKLLEAGNNKILITERGTSFGYNNLVVDMTSLYELINLHYPVILDVTHAVQKPGGLGEKTGGKREYIETLMKAGIASGADAIFAEVHPNPESALSDGPNMIKLEKLERILVKMIKLNDVCNYLD
jgi:2-dehydro-3-deoxyphosphooctonate aldolase (KDO 8-P synthase)